MQKLAPKERFLTNKPAAQAWFDYSASPAFHAVMETTLAEVATKLASSNQLEAMAAHYQLAGARLFAHTLLNLAERSMTQLPPVETQLAVT